ncbi:response regulator [Mesorhizobium sp. M0437]|uniref:response regulator n=1 Tax=Mesorhizobium sp. M0437 TaxID=2956945 RepID=UPI0033357967
MSAEQNIRHEQQSKGSTEQPAAPKHILVVDDDPEIRDMLTNYLESQNFRVSAVADSRAMSRVLNEKPVDLTILDMRLADEDGFDIMRQLGSPPEAPIIIITGHRCDEVDRVVGLELGADDYITKPFASGSCWRAFAPCCGDRGRRSRSRAVRNPYAIVLPAGSSTCGCGA